MHPQDHRDRVGAPAPANEAESGLPWFDRAALLCIAFVGRLLGLAFVAAVLVNLANVASRYLLDRAIVGADEVLVFTMVWTVFLGAAVAALRNDHLRMDVLVTMLAPRLRRALGILHLAVTAVLASFVVVQSWAFLERIYRIGQVSLGAEIPMIVPHAALTTGFALIAAAAALRLAQSLFAGSATRAGS